mmetsp:Transcript_51473/g.166971  ORF Transcript_51473/g.166971 Transcript_51473/m.166971 type:complete len:209 (-) Transcript_51473:59-685(-)
MHVHHVGLHLRSLRSLHLRLICRHGRRVLVQGPSLWRPIHRHSATSTCRRRCSGRRRRVAADALRHRAAGRRRCSRARLHGLHGHARAHERPGLHGWRQHSTKGGHARWPHRRWRWPMRRAPGRSHRGWGHARGFHHWRGHRGWGHARRLHHRRGLGPAAAKATTAIRRRRATTFRIAEEALHGRQRRCAALAPPWRPSPGLTRPGQA